MESITCVFTPQDTFYRIEGRRYVCVYISEWLWTSRMRLLLLVFSQTKRMCDCGKQPEEESLLIHLLPPPPTLFLLLSGCEESQLLCVDDGNDGLCVCVCVRVCCLFPSPLSPWQIVWVYQRCFGLDPLLVFLADHWSSWSLAPSAGTSSLTALIFCWRVSFSLTEGRPHFSCIPPAVEMRLGPCWSTFGASGFQEVPRDSFECDSYVIMNWTEQDWIILLCHFHMSGGDRTVVCCPTAFIFFTEQ